MTQFVIVEASTGLILGGAGRPDPEDFGGVPALRPMPHGGKTYYAWQGRLQFDPPTPTSEYRWVNDAPTWVESAPLSELKARKNNEINAKREQLNTDTFMYAGKAIRCRPLDRSDIDGTNGYVALFGTFPDDWKGVWKCADNSYVPISTIDDWKAFYKAMVDTGNANFLKAQYLKAKLELAETPEQVLAIIWD